MYFLLGPAMHGNLKCMGIWFSLCLRIPTIFIFLTTLMSTFESIPPIFNQCLPLLITKRLDHSHQALVVLHNFGTASRVNLGHVGLRVTCNSKLAMARWKAERVYEPYQYKRAAPSDKPKPPRLAYMKNVAATQKRYTDKIIHEASAWNYNHELDANPR